MNTIEGMVANLPLPTEADARNAQIADRVERSLRYVDPTTGRLLDLGGRIGAAITEDEYARQQGRHAERRRRLEQEEREREESRATTRAYHERELADLKAFAAAVAKHFDCPALGTHNHTQVRLRPMMQELQRLVRQLPAG